MITDFGCCIANKRLGLSLPFASLDTDRGGNTALMAPEVVKARPGPWVSINYARSDLWTAGAIGYQIFGAENPFTVGGLSSRSYTCSQLPRLPPAAPALLPPLLRWILAPAPSRLNTRKKQNKPDSLFRRPSPRLAVTVSQLLLWAPSDWSSGRCVVFSVTASVLFFFNIFLVKGDALHSRHSPVVADYDNQGRCS